MTASGMPPLFPNLGRDLSPGLLHDAARLHSPRHFK